MFSLFRRPVAETAKPSTKRKVPERSAQPLSWEDQFAPIPKSDAVEGNDDRDWTLWDDSAASALGKAENVREGN